MFRRVLHVGSNRRFFSENSNCWEVLGVDDSADMKTIRKRYKLLAVKYHPDMPNGDVGKMKLVNRAFAEAKKGGPVAKKGNPADDNNFKNGVGSTFVDKTFHFIFGWLCRFLSLDIEKLRSMLRQQRPHNNKQQSKQQHQKQHRRQQEVNSEQNWGEFSPNKSQRVSHQPRRNIRRPIRNRTEASSRTTAANASKFDLLTMADQIASELHVKPHALWYNRERLQSPEISTLLKGLQQDQRDLKSDKDDAIPMTKTRLSWYSRELTKAVKIHNTKRKELLLTILEERGDVDLTEFESFYEDDDNSDGNETQTPPTPTTTTKGD